MIKTRQQRLVKIVAKVELTIELDLRPDEIEAMLEDGEIDQEDADGEWMDLDIKDLLDVEKAKGVLIDEAVSVKSGLFENRLWGSIVEIVSTEAIQAEPSGDDSSVTD